MRKIVFLIVAAGVSLALAGEFLAIVPNAAPDDVAARYTVVGVTGHGVLILVDDSRGGFASQDGRFLAENPKAHLYYTVRLFARALRADLVRAERVCK